MKRINDLISHKYLFLLSPQLYKKFWKKKFLIDKVFAYDPETIKIEPEVLLLQHLINQKSVFFDIGSNVGLYLFWAEKFGLNKVFAFEPIPFLHKKLKQIFKYYKIENIALSNQKTTAILKVPITSNSNNEAKASLINFKNNNESYSEYIVETQRLDDYCNENRVFPDFIKIDVEGAEELVLQGAKNVIEKYRPIMLIEIELRHNINSQQIIANLIALNYRCLHFNNIKTRIVEYTDIHTLQSTETIETKNYVNNFLFVSNEKSELINKLLNFKML